MKKWQKRQERGCVRAIALLLILSILAWGQGTAALADTLSGNSADAEALDVEKTAEPEMALEAQAQAGTPANPVHHCVQKDDSTDYSYVYFGSYPQSEVTDKETIKAIEAAIAAASTDEIAAEGADAVKTVGVDVELELDDGIKIKYRRIANSYADYDSNKYFGDAAYRYFQWEPIKWRVLNKDDNGTLFVMADSMLDCKRYNESFGTITWEKSTIRSWLNVAFFETAFSSGEQNAIMQWHVETEDNSYYTNGGKGGEDTEDHVYLLSIEEMSNDRYGFCSDYSGYSPSRELQPSDYAHARGVWRIDSGGVAQREDGAWWLRSPGGSGTYAANVTHNGFVNTDGQYASYSNSGVLPVLHINLSRWSVADDGTGEEGAANTERNLANPVHHCKNKPDYTEFSYLYFGSYPQSEVTDEETITAIKNAIVSGNSVVGDLGVDVWIGDMKYRRIIKDDTGEDDTGDDGYRYFMWRRIKWRVLNANDDGTLFVMADSALDCKEYHVEETAITWENSTIRSWLNGSFYEIAFSSGEQEAIKLWKVVNEEKPEYGEVVGRDTTDHIYLLSIGEVTNEGYGFCSDYRTESESRYLQASDYAHARGVPGSISANCAYWLRAPGELSRKAARVYSFGSVNSAGTSVANQNSGVAPVLHINLSSDRWFQEDDGTSGEGGGIPTESDDDGSDTGTGGTGTGVGADPAAVKVTSLSIKAPSKKLAAGKKVKLSVNVKPSNATNQSVKWEISNKKYVSIDQKGKLKLKKAGAGKIVTVTARAADGSGVKASYKIKIMKHAVKKVKITAALKTVKAGKKIKLKAVVTTTGKHANKALKWSSSNRNYATVNSKGLVKTKKAGKGKTVTITARATDGSNKSAKVKIKIK